MEAEREECAAQARDERGTHTRARARIGRKQLQRGERGERVHACMRERLSVCGMLEYFFRVY